MRPAHQRHAPWGATALLLLAGSGLVGACAHPGPQPVNPRALTPTQQYSVELAPAVDEILLAPHGILSPGQTAALGELVMRWREDGEDAIVVQGPQSGPAHGTALAAAELVKSYGVPAVVQLEGGRLGAGAPDAVPAPVRVGFARLEAVLPDCSSRWGELTRTRENAPHAAFGCAVTANLAAQAANPRDLVQPRQGAPADAGRRMDVLDKYRQGQDTAARSGDQGGVVSTAVQ